ncbi:MAG TPA: hypothetical protein VFK90_05305 [Anaeromyxobacter sp.]|nr:hypothetical protein [Anaeromyxobacter sp.]
MPVDTAFAPYRLAPGALPEEAARAAEIVAAEPLLAAPAEPLPAPLVNRALADVAAGRAAPGAEPCRAADGSVAGGGGPPRACLSSERQRARVAEAERAALEAGFAGVCLDRPDAPLALGLLGAGFCPECQRDLARELSRAYGEHFQPINYLALAREAVAQAPGAISFAQLPFGHDFWRVRNEALARSVRDAARAARDAARAAGRPFDVVAQFEAIGPAQLQAVRHLDAAIFPAPVAQGASGIGLFRLLRAAAGRRPCAVAPANLPAEELGRLSAVAATCGVDLSGVEPAGERGREIARVRKLARQLQANGLAPAQGDPVAECAVLYSAEADLWTGGRHRAAVERAVELLSALHVQAAVVLRASDAPPGAALVLADAAALSAAEAKDVQRQLEGGEAVLSFGEAAAVDEGGRPRPTFLPSARARGTKVGEGTLSVLPALFPEKRGEKPPEPALVEKALATILGKGRRAAGVAARVPLLVVLHRTGGTLLAHLVAPQGERAQGATLFLGVHVAGGARRARFVSAEGADVRIPMNPSGYSVSTVLPAFRGYAVLSLSP